MEERYIYYSGKILVRGAKPYFVFDVLGIVILVPLSRERRCEWSWRNILITPRPQNHLCNVMIGFHSMAGGGTDLIGRKDTANIVTQNRKKGLKRDVRTE